MSHSVSCVSAGRLTHVTLTFSSSDVSRSTGAFVRYRQITPRWSGRAGRFHTAKIHKPQHHNCVVEINRSVGVHQQVDTSTSDCTSSTCYQYMLVYYFLTKKNKNKPDIFLQPCAPLQGCFWNKTAAFVVNALIVHVFALKTSNTSTKPPTTNFCVSNGLCRWN